MSQGYSTAITGKKKFLCHANFAAHLIWGALSEGRAEIIPIEPARVMPGREMSARLT